MTQPDTNKVDLHHDDAPAKRTGQPSTPPLDSLALSPSQQSMTHTAQYAAGHLLGGHYQVISRLGSGGMGVIYKVKQIFLNTEFALKTINKHQLSDISIRRFQQEARTAFALDHPNIIKVHDFGVLDDQTPFFVMDIAEGDTLAERVRKIGPLSVSEAMPIFSQVCSGLAYAHDHGVVHRDIKPSNIILLEELLSGKVQNVRIVDFGIAKLSEDEGGEIQSLTRTGEVFGSPLYMSPEQCSGERVDHRSDIYSLGCVLFEALTGTPPFVADNPLSTMMCHQNETAPSLKEATLGTEFPQALEDIVATMLAKKPENRYQSLHVLARHLSAIQRGDSAALVSAKPAESHKRTPDKISMPLGTFCALHLIIAILSVSATYFSIQMNRQQQAQLALARSMADASKTMSDNFGLTKAEMKVMGENYFEQPDNLAKKLANPIAKRYLRERNTVLTSAKLKAIGKTSWIENLDFIGSHLSNKDLGLLAKLNIKQLDLTSTNFDDVGAKAITPCQTIQRVHANFTPLTDVGVADLLKLPKLQSLMLSGTSITDKSMFQLAQHKDLTMVALERVYHITPAGISALEANKSLVELNLDRTQVDDAALMHLASLSALKSIDLSDTKVSITGVEALCKGCKNLKKVCLARCPNIRQKDLLTLRQEFGDDLFFERSFADEQY